MADSINPFLENSGDYIQPNAIFNPEQYERLGLYVLLYNEIEGSLADYGIENRIELDVRINSKIKSIVGTANKIYNNRRKGAPDTDGFSSSDNANYKHAIEWMGRLLPLDAGYEKDSSGAVIKDASGKPYYRADVAEQNAKYTYNFIQKFDSVVREEQRVAALKGKKALNIEEGRLLLEAKRKKVRELYDYVRANQDYKPGKFDKEGKSKSGVHATAYFEALNELEKMKRDLRRNQGFNFLKSFAAGGCLLGAGGGIGLLGTFGTGALTAIVGVGGAAVAANLALTALGVVMIPFGWNGFKNFRKRAQKGRKKSFEMKEKIRAFVGEPYKGKDLERFLAGNWDKDGKSLTLNEKKTLYMFDKAAKAYFELKPKTDENGKPVGYPEGFPEEYKQYLPMSVVKKFSMDGDKRWFNYVSDGDQPFAKILDNYSHVVQNVPGDGKYTHTEALAHIQNALAKTGDSAATISELEELSEFTEAYSDVLTKAKAAEFQKVIGAKMAVALQKDIFENAYTNNTYTDVDNAVNNNETIKKGLEVAGVESGNAKAKIQDSLAFLKTERESTDGVLKENIGVNIVEQMDFSKASMEKACRTLGEGALPTEVSNAITAIVNMKTKDKFSAIESQISAIEGMTFGSSSVVPVKVGQYLRHMLNKRKAGSKHSKTGLVNEIKGTATLTTQAATELDEITNCIADLSYTAGKGVNPGVWNAETKDAAGNDIVVSIDEIRKKIIDSSLSDEQKEKAFALLDEQIKSIERRGRDNSRTSALKTIKGNADVGKYSTIMEKIKGLTFASLSNAETTELYEKIVKEGGLKDYLVSQFKSKVEKLFEAEIREVLKVDTNDAGFDKVMNMMKTINQYSYIDAAQKTRLSSKLTDMLGKCLENKLEKMEKDYLDSMSTPDKQLKFDEILTNWMKNGYENGGLVDLFKLNDPRINDVKRRIENLRSAQNVSRMLNAQIGGLAGAEDNNSSEAKMFSFLYFANYDVKYNGQNQTDKINAYLKQMETYSTNASASEFSQSGPNLNTGSFIDNMKQTIDAIYNDPDMSNQAKLAALLVAKKRCMAAFKLNLQKYLGPNAKTGVTVNNLDTFFAGTYTYTDPTTGVTVTKTGAEIFNDDVISIWKNEMFSSLDDKIDDLASQTVPGSTNDINNVKDFCKIYGLRLGKSGVEFINSSTQSGAQTYLSSSQLQRS